MIGFTKLLCGVATIGEALNYSRETDSATPAHMLQFTTADKPLVAWNTTRRCNLRCLHCYLDSENEQTTVVKVYSFEPIPPQLSVDKTNHILGLEAAMWTHLSPTLSHIDRQVFPRLCALAEVGWSPKDLRDWTDFRERLKLHCSRLFLQGVNYFREWEWTDPAHPYYRDYYR